MMLCYNCTENLTNYFISWGNISLPVCEMCHAQNNLSQPTPNVETQTGRLILMTQASNRFRPPTR